MRGLKNKLIEMRTTRDIDKARKLPLAVLIQKPCCRKVYRIDDVQAYFDEAFRTQSGRHTPFPSVSMVEQGCQKYGKVVSEESMKDIGVLFAQSGYQEKNLYWELYRADFENVMESSPKSP